MTDKTPSPGSMSADVDVPPHLDAATVAAYLDSGLPPERRASVEAHLEDCAACRAEVVQLRGIVPRSRTPRRGVLLGIGVAAAAALLLFLSPTDVGVPDGAGRTARADSLALRIRALGDVAQPPIYLGVSVRESTPAATEQFSTGMRAYTGAQYAEAVTSLRAARSAGVEGAATPFFLGASLLMLDDAKGAAEEFARVIAMGDTPYQAEAHYYRAKALLRLNQPADAVVELDRSVQSGEEPIKSAARALRDSLRVLGAR